MNKFFQQNMAVVSITKLHASKRFETSEKYCVQRPILFNKSAQVGDNLPSLISQLPYIV